MAEVTYYFNARHASEVWTTDPDYMVDNILTNYAETTLDADIQRLITNDCPGTDLGVITKVEVRAYGYGDVDDQLIIRPEFVGGAGDNHITVPGVGAGWGAYQDITSDPNAPDWSLWSHIQTLDVDIEMNDVAKGNLMHCAKVEIRVTYWSPPVSDIDVGAIPIDRAASTGAPAYTFVDKNNPANASGTLTAIKIWPLVNLENLVVGTFYTTNGNTLKCRDSEAIGAVEAGAERTFTDLSIAVEAGDYIGCYFTAGDIDADTSGFSGIWLVLGEYIDPGDETTYTLVDGDAMSLYGYGDAGGTTAYKDIATRFRLWSQGFKDIATRFKLWVQNYQDIATRFKLTVQNYQDVSTRFILNAQAYKDITTRFKLAVQNYQDITTRFRLIAQNYKDISTRFKLITGTPAWNDIATRFKLTIQGYQDAATRFLLLAQGFQDIAARFKLTVQGYQDAVTRFRLNLGFYRDITTRFILRVQGFQDIVTRFRLNLGFYQDIATRFRLIVQGYQDVATRFILALPSYKDIATRFILALPSYKDVATRFGLSALFYRDISTRFALYVPSWFELLLQQEILDLEAEVRGLEHRLRPIAHFRI